MPTFLYIQVLFGEEDCRLMWLWGRREDDWPMGPWGWGEDRRLKGLLDRYEEDGRLVGLLDRCEGDSRLVGLLNPEGLLRRECRLVGLLDPEGLLRREC